LLVACAVACYLGGVVNRLAPFVSPVPVGAFTWTGWYVFLAGVDITAGRWVALLSLVDTLMTCAIAVGCAASLAKADSGSLAKSQSDAAGLPNKRIERTPRALS
jgi:hypothetical protein